MNAIRLLTTIVLFCGCFAASGSAEEDFSAGPATDVPQLLVLDRLRGEWAGTIGDGDGKIEQTSRWILDGHVLQTKFEVGPHFKGLILRTYDAQDDVYVATYMDAEGSVVLMTGEWNETQQTLTTSGKDGDDIVTLVTRFVDKQTAQWTITQSTGGDETTRIGGTNRLLRR